MSDNNANLHRYLNQMNLIKTRQKVISNVMSKRYSTGFIYSDIEICILEIRKIIELIAMSSLVSNIEQYSEIHEKYSKDWNAKYIFNDIEQINNSFYTQPVKIDKSKEIDEFINVVDGFLTRDLL